MRGRRYMSASIRPATIEDASEIHALYRRVAAKPGGIARLEEEVSGVYVRAFLTRALSDGVALVVIDKSAAIVAEIHAYTPDPYCFSHVFSELTVVVDPTTQGKGIGKSIIAALLQAVTETHPEIRRVELIARESNEKAIMLYESLGFRKEGKLVGRIRNVDGNFESDIPMAWLNRQVR